MRCDSRASLLAHTLASPCLGRKPKARVATQKQLGHLLTLQTCLHGEHPCLMHLVEREKKLIIPKQDAQNLNVI